MNAFKTPAKTRANPGDLRKLSSMCRQIPEFCCTKIQIIDLITIMDLLLIGWEIKYPPARHSESRPAECPPNQLGRDPKIVVTRSSHRLSRMLQAA